MKIWIGKSIATIGIIHTIFGFVFIGHIFRELLNDGLINTVNGQLDREFFFWFVMFGVLLIVLGALTNWVEKETGFLPSWYGWVLFVFTLMIVAIMPASGGWLLFIPAVGILMRYRSGKIKTHSSLSS